MFKIRTLIFAAAALSAATVLVPLARSASGKHAGRSARFHNTHAAARATRNTDYSLPNAVPDEVLAQSRVTQGFRIAPVVLNLQNKDLQMVGLGSYLVNAVGGCNDCHTNPSYAEGGDPFKGQSPILVNAKGYLGGGQTFGPFTSRNLTPEPAEGFKPAGMDFDEFLHVMRTGEDTDKAHPQMGPLLQVMPWPAYRNMTDYELRAIYEYLSAIPVVEVAGAK